MTLRELINLIKFDVDKGSLMAAEKQIDAAIGKLDRFGKRASLLLTTPILALAGFSVKVASDTNEIQNKVNQVFGGLSEKVTQFVDTFSKGVGRFRGDIMEGLSAFQSMFVGLGYSNEEAAEMSMRMQQLAIDFGSFNNLSDKEAIQRFVSAMAGSSQVLDMYGINIKESAMQQEFLAMGLHKTSATATEAEKAMARLNIIEKTMGRQGAIGDASRTLLEFANNSRAFFSSIKNVMSGFGEMLLPILNKILGVGRKLLDWIDGLNKSVKITALIFAGLLAIIGPLSLGLVGLLTTVKLLMMFNTFIGGLAGLKSAFLVMLQPQFLLIAAAILVAVAALALFIEDVVTWVQGGDSLIGRLLGPWEKWKDGLKEAFNLAKEDFGTFMKALVIAVDEGLADAFEKFTHFVTRISDALSKSDIGRMIKFFTGIEGVEYAAEKLGSLHGKLSSLTFEDKGWSFSPSGIAARMAQPAAAAAGGAGAKTFNVSSTVHLQVPLGTPQDQAVFVKKAAEDAFRFGLSAEMRKLLDNEGGR